jgi:hypothetical protein
MRHMLVTVGLSTLEEACLIASRTGSPEPSFAVSSGIPV